MSTYSRPGGRLSSFHRNYGDPNIHRLIDDIDAFLSERTTSGQLVDRRLDDDRNRYTITLRDISREFWYEVIRPEMQHLAKRHNYIFRYSSSLPERWGYVMEFDSDCVVYRLELGE